MDEKDAELLSLAEQWVRAGDVARAEVAINLVRERRLQRAALASLTNLTATKAKGSKSAKAKRSKGAVEEVDEWMKDLRP